MSNNLFLSMQYFKSMCSSLPSMSDAARKRTLADWTVKIKKQVVKVYAIVRWARDADDVQKAMVRSLQLCTI